MSAHTDPPDTLLAGNAAPLPEAQAGPTPGTNRLFRLHYFNGRLLTAESEQTEQHYWDARSRLPARVHGPGIAWGLQLRVERSVDAPGLAAGDPITLAPGLAFDAAGRPIAVGGQGHTFSLDALLLRYRETPLVLAAGDTRFGPCIQVVPRGEVIAASGIAPGPYLLVILPAEQPEGAAQVYRAACSDPHGAECRPDGWRGGFTLALVRYPLTLSDQDQAADGWTLRSLVASHYFHTREQSLAARWGPAQATDPERWEGARAHPVGPVSLAMLYLRDGQATFLDAWIVRRELTDTVAEHQAAGARGAPPPAVVTARLHQFQTQLAEVLTARTQAGAPVANLHDMGLRCIPPWGFLPVGMPDGTDPLGTDPGTLAGAKARSVLLQHAREGGRAFFAGTNVATYTTVAWRDDDILPAMAAASDLDPVCLTPAGDGPGLDDALEHQITGDADDQGNWRHRAARILAEQALRSGVAPERILNRHQEIVRIIVVLEGLHRVLPVIGALHPPSGLPERPRHFVVYVRERLELGYWTWLAVTSIAGVPNNALRDPAFWPAWDQRLAASGNSPSDALDALRGSYDPGFIDHLAHLLSTLGKPGFARFMQEARELGLP